LGCVREQCQLYPAGAKVLIDGLERGTTPVTLKLDPRRSYTLVLKKEGDPDQVHELRNSVGAGWIVLDILLGVVPVIVDAATGNWHYFDSDQLAVRFPSVTAAEMLPPFRSQEPRQYARPVPNFPRAMSRRLRSGKALELLRKGHA
jgi:hypothetical protein